MNIRFETWVNERHSFTLEWWKEGFLIIGSRHWRKICQIILRLEISFWRNYGKIKTRYDDLSKRFDLKYVKREIWTCRLDKWAKYENLGTVNLKQDSNQNHWWL